MPPELTALTLAALLQVGQICLYSVAGRSQVGTRIAIKSRDEPINLTGKPGRIYRAMNNHFEGLILFTIACIVVTLANQSTAFTTACAFTCLGARVLYIPAYVFGWVPWRSVIWGAGLVATTCMLGAALI